MHAPVAGIALKLLIAALAVGIPGVLIVSLAGLLRPGLETGFVGRLRHFLHSRPPVPARVPWRCRLGSTPCCPRCSAPMVRRTVGDGPRHGLHYWGCSAHPECHGTRPLC